MSIVIPARQRALARRRAVVLVPAVIVAGVLAALVGVWAGRVAAPPNPEPPPVRVVSVGAARLVVPADWQPARLRSTGIAGLDAEHAVAFERPGLSLRAVAIFAPTVEPSLIPRELRSAFPGHPPAPRAARVGSWPAWTYHLTAGSSGLHADATVLATTAGVLAIVCTTIVPSAADPGCAADVESITVGGAVALVPSRSLALELRLPTVLDGLNRARSRHRAALSRADTAESQARAARRLGADHRAAARVVRAAAGPAGMPLVRDLTGAAEAYHALGQAAAESSPAGFEAARAAVRQADAELARGVADVPRPITARATRTGSIVTVRQGHNVPSGSVPAVLFVLLMLLAAAAGVATGSSEVAPRIWRSAAAAARLAPRL
jgi:hypothetical protein